MDAEKWTQIGDREISSSDFTHDVLLRVDGDFETKDQEQAYITALIDKLNSACDKC